MQIKKTLNKIRIKGFTLIELLIVIVVSGVIVAVSSELLVQGFRAFFMEKSYINADLQGRVALERMARDLRAVRSSSDITTATSSQFSFIDINNNTVTYCVSGTQLLRGNLSSCSGQGLANGVSSLTFTYYDSDGAVAPASNSLIRYILVNFNIAYYGKISKFTTLIYPWNLTT